MGNRGQPKITFYIKFVIAYKVIQYQKRYNLTPFKAWIELTNHKAFKSLMREHFKNFLLKFFMNHDPSTNLLLSLVPVLRLNQGDIAAPLTCMLFLNFVFLI